MKRIRKIIAVSICGIVIGGTMSVMTTSSATARNYSCDQRIDSMEKKAARDYAKGKISDETYLNIQAEISDHRDRWGC